jgi:hypothetical protein
MRLVLAIFLLAASALAARLEPVGKLHEFLTYAVELPDSRVCVLTPQRLVLLASADAKTVVAEHPTSAFGQRRFVLYKGHILVSNTRGIEILRITEDGFETVAEIELRYAWQGSLAVAHDQLFAFQAGQELHVYSLADLSAPRHLRKLDLPKPGASILAEGKQLYLGEPGRLTIYDISNPAEMPSLGRVEWPINQVGAMHLHKSTLYVTSEAALYTVSVTDPEAMTVSKSETQLRPAEFAIGRPDGFSTFSIYHRAHISLATDGIRVDSETADWPVIGQDPGALGEALASSGLWARRLLQGAATFGTHIALFDGRQAKIFDLADFANPRQVGSCAFSGSIGKPVLHGQRIYTNSGVLDVSVPSMPTRNDLPLATQVQLDGDTLYRLYGRTLTQWSLSGDTPEQIGSHDTRLNTSFLVHRGFFYFIDDGMLRIAQLADGDLTKVNSLKVGGGNSRNYSMAIDDDFLYIATYYSGLRLIDIHDPANPRLLVSFPERLRYEQVLGKSGIAFTTRGSRYLTAVDLRRKVGLLEYGPPLGHNFIDTMGNHLLAALPGAGIGIFRSPALAALTAAAARQAPLRARLVANPEDLDARGQLAMLCDQQGDVWTADRHFAALEGQQLNAEMAEALADFEARRKADAEAAAAAAAFEEDLREQRIGDVEREQGRIVRLRVFKPGLMQRHRAHLATLPLKNLDIYKGPIGPQELALLKHFPNLQHLRLRGVAGKAEAFAPLATLAKLQYLNLEDCALPEGALAHIAKLPALTYLDLEDTGTGDADLAHLAGLVSLQTLDLEGCPISDAGLKHLSALRKLERLRLQDCSLTGEGFVHLVGLKSLEELDLERVPATQGYAVLANLTRLRELDLDQSGISNAELAHVAELKNLENLQLGYTGIGAEGITHLTSLGAVTTLDLAGTQTDDLALSLIGGMTNLQNLDLQKTTISDTGIRQLAGLQALQWISVENVPDFSDRGLEALAALKSLRRISARGTSVTAAGVAALPQVEVQWVREEPQEGQTAAAEEIRIAKMPETLAFDIVDNALRLLDAANGEEYARETPAELFGLGEIELRDVLAWEQECWVASNRGLLRFAPRARVWSRFAIDREHLEVAVSALRIEEQVLVVGFGSGREARFDLHERRWSGAAPAPVAAIATVPEAQPPKAQLSWTTIAIGALVLMGGLLLLRRAV